MFLVRPPALGNVKRDLLPAVAAARDAGVEHVVFLSLQGAQRNKVVPHATVEAWLRDSVLSWTFVRASFFCQNLTTTHVIDVRDRDEIVVPAGRGATAFVDTEDVCAVAAAALLDPALHADRAWTVTGPRALTYAQVAQILSAELDRPIRYDRPGALRYARHAHRVLEMPGRWWPSRRRSTPPRAWGSRPPCPTTYALCWGASRSTSSNSLTVSEPPGSDYNQIGAAGVAFTAAYAVIEGVFAVPSSSTIRPRPRWTVPESGSG